MRRFIFFVLLFALHSAIGAASSDLDAHQVAVISDIHFSPFADCNSAKNCILITKLNQASAAQWPQILAQYSSNTLPANGQPTNYALFRSLLTQLQQEKPKNLLILGDFLAHRYRSQYLKYSHDHNRSHYEAFVLNTLQYLTNALQQTMSADGAIYPVIGNNDSYGGKDCTYSDYCSIANGAFYQALANQWSPLLRNDDNKAQFMTTFPYAGYYEVILPNTHNHIIALNTVLFSTKAQGPDVDKVAQAQLQWLQKKLQALADNHEKAWIIFHIPPGIDAYSTAKNFLGVVVPFWEKNDSQQFISLLHQYNTVITGVLSGHLHMDGFLILDMRDSQHIILDTFVSSISPIFGNNPAYKTYTYDAKDFTFRNFTTYYLNLKEKNQAATWQKEYDFSAVYQPNDGLFSGYQKITHDPVNSFSTDYIHFYAANTKSQPISHNRWNYYWCAIHWLNPNSYQGCLKKTIPPKTNHNAQLSNCCHSEKG